MNKLVTLNYILASLMVATGIIYFVVAFYGESFEGQEENHQAEAIENDSIINDNTRDNKEKLENAERHSAAVEESENGPEISSPEEEKENNEATVNQENVEEIQEGKEVEGKEGIEREFNQKEAVEERESENESVKRSVEFPIFLSAAIGNVLVGSWIFLDKRNKRKSPYIIAIFGTLALLGIYIISRTTSIQPVGIERVGLLDSVTAALQVGIIICSGYVLKTWQNRIVKVY